MRPLSAAAIDSSAAVPVTISLAVLSLLLLLSAISLVLVVSLRIHSRNRDHLSIFTPLLPLRLTLTSLILIWALHSILILRPTFVYPVFCKLHIIVSLGLLQPAFLITALFLIHLSIKKASVQGAFWSILISLLPALALQILSVVFLSPPPFKSRLPSVFTYESSVRTIDDSYVCTYPLFSIVAFALFGIVYNIGFLFTYWRVIRLVINKGTSIRIHVLAWTLLICIPLQVLLMVSSSHWGPGKKAYDIIVVGMVGIVVVCAAIVEVILVIKPVADALSASRGWICGGAQAVEGRR